ncbi:MAG TPA: FAD-dependent oxidoreductase [Bacteroidota bacterium]|nr:FAD-dependent oxidoreductase [Bacteroidota bacterium]
MSNDTDVLIIGAGAVGLSIAYYLRQEGLSVRIVEKDFPGAGSSLKNCGLICPSHYVPLAHPGVITAGLKWMLDPVSPFYVKPRIDMGLISWLLKFREASRVERSNRSMPLLFMLNDLSANLYREIAARKIFTFEYDEKGLLLVYNTPEGREENLKEAEVGLKFGIPIKEVKAADIGGIDPNLKLKSGGAFHYGTDTHMSPQKFVEGMAAHVVKDGVEIATGAGVTGIDARDGTISAVRTTKGEFRAKEYVLAGGAWSQNLVRSLGLKLPIQPAKGYSITFPRTPDMFSTPMILTERKVAITPLGDQVRYGGTLELTGFNLSINMRRVQAIANTVPVYLENVRVPAFSESDVWSGLRPCSPDGLPYVGRTQKFKNLVTAAGHAMLGITLSPVTGKLVSEIVTGKTPSIDCTLLRPDRFA